jgi:hypothetical protein
MIQKKKGGQKKGRKCIRFSGKTNLFALMNARAIFQARHRHRALVGHQLCVQKRRVAAFKSKGSQLSANRFLLTYL